MPTKIEPVVTKVDDYIINVVTTPTVEPTSANYDLTFLKNQFVAIQQQLDDYTAARQAELDEVQVLIDAAITAGVVERPIDPTPVVIDPTPIDPIPIKKGEKK